LLAAPVRTMRQRFTGGAETMQQLMEGLCADADAAREPDAIDQFGMGKGDSRHGINFGE